MEKAIPEKPILLPHKFHDELERVCQETQNHTLRHSEFGLLMKSLQEVPRAWPGRGVVCWARPCFSFKAPLPAFYNTLGLLCMPNAIKQGPSCPSARIPVGGDSGSQNCLFPSTQRGRMVLHAVRRRG